jgi:hypothetical protein
MWICNLFIFLNVLQTICVSLIYSLFGFELLKINLALSIQISFIFNLSFQKLISLISWKLRLLFSWAQCIIIIKLTYFLSIIWFSWSTSYILTKQRLIAKISLQSLSSLDFLATVFGSFKMIKFIFQNSFWNIIILQKSFFHFYISTREHFMFI